MPEYPFDPPPEGNSDDLTDAEIHEAIPTESIDDIVKWLRNAVCATCGKPARAIQYSLRRRIPKLYWRTGLCCPVGHETARVFEVPWLGRR